jgi:hypothetical protein
MVAASLSLILLLVVTGLLFQSKEYAEKVKARPFLNAKAREMMEMLGNGGYDPTTGNDVIALRGFAAHQGTIPAGNPPSNMRTAAQRLHIDQIVSDPEKDNVASASSPFSGTITSTDASQTTVSCRGVRDPIPDCSSAGTTVQVRGYLGDDPAFTSDVGRRVNDADRNIDNRTIELGIIVIHPSNANRVGFRKSDVVEGYRNIFTFNRSPAPVAGPGFPPPGGPGFGPGPVGPGFGPGPVGPGFGPGFGPGGGS